MKDDQRNRLDDGAADQLLHRPQDATGVEELRTLSAVLRVAATPPADADEPLPTAGEEAALAAFRTARAAAPQPGRRRTAASLKAVTGAVAVALVFGGVAVAAQTGVLRLPFSGRQEPGPDGVRDSASASARPSTTPAAGAPDDSGRSSAPAGGQESPGTPSSSGTADAQAAAGSLRGLCTAYRTSRQSHGNPHSFAGLRRLVQAAGSEGAVADYCAELLGSGGTGDTRGGSTPGGDSAGKTPGDSPSKKAK